MAESTTPPTLRDAPAHVALATVFQVRDGALCVLLWERAREPFSGAWALPGGTLVAGRDARELDPPAPRDEGRRARGLAPRAARDVERSRPASRALGARDRLPGARAARHRSRAIPADTRWHSVDALPETAFDHGAIVLAGRDRLRGKLSYSNIGFALAPETFTLAELRDVYEAALGYEVSSTNLKRVLVRRGAIEAVGKRRAHGPAGGRPAGAVSVPRAGRLEVTDPFARLRPPALSSQVIGARKPISCEHAALSDVAARDRAREPRGGGDRRRGRVLARRRVRCGAS